MLKWNGKASTVFCTAFSVSSFSNFIQFFSKQFPNKLSYSHFTNTVIGKPGSMFTITGLTLINQINCFTIAHFENLQEMLSLQSWVSYAKDLTCLLFFLCLNFLNNFWTIPLFQDSTDTNEYQKTFPNFFSSFYFINE
jgi:hypothetical protein